MHLCMCVYVHRDIYKIQYNWDMAIIFLLVLKWIPLCYHCQNKIK